MTPTVLHLFAGSGGCTLGFQRAGFRSLGSLDFDAVAELGYRARAFALSAADVGAPHVRRRIFIVGALPDAHGVELREQPRRSGGADGGGAPIAGDDGSPGPVADRNGNGRQGERCGGLLDRERAALGDDAHRRGGSHAWPPLRGDVDGWREWLAGGGPPAAVPRLRRSPDGLPGGMDRDRAARLKALGNAVVPQCAEVIGRIVVEEFYALGR